MRKFIKIIALVLTLTLALSMSACFAVSTPSNGGNGVQNNGQDNADGNGYNSGECSHTYGEWTVKTEPNCKYKGYECRTCSKCGTEEGKQIPIVDHTYGEYVTIEAASCEKSGSRKHTCTVCDHTETETVEKLGHNYGADNKCTICSEGKYGTQGLLFTLQKATDPYPDTYKVSRGTATDMNIVIPAEYNGKPVTYIDEEAFAGMELKSLVIGANVKKIGDNAFVDCQELKTVSFKSGSQLETVDGFSGCISLTSISIPANVTRVESSAFRGCTELNGVYFDHTDGWYKGYAGSPGGSPCDVRDSHQNALTLQYIANNNYFFRFPD